MSAPVNVSLQVEASSLDQVVVVGYGTVQKKDLTGSVTRIDMTEKVQNNLNILQAIQGEVPGLNAMGGGALAGDEPSLSIRGQTSLSASDRPLIVLDNVIFNGSITEINVNDVETIDVLKDASAAAVYGSRSANGVMLITTKKGKTDKPRFSFNSSYGLQDFAKLLPVMNADQYAIRLVDYYWEQQLYTWYKSNPTSAAGRPVRPDVTNRNIVATTLRSEEEKNNYLAGGHDINWIDEVSRTSTLQNYDLNISGRNAKSNYYISGSYSDQKGVLLNDRFKRATVRTNIESKITDWMTLGIRSSYSHRDFSGLETGLERARFASPLVNMYNANGTYPMYFGTETYQVHPFANLLVDNEEVRNNVSVLGTANIKLPIEGLTYDLRYSNTLNTSRSNTFYPPTIFDGSSNNGQANRNNFEESNWLMDNILTYSRTFADHRVNGTMLFSRENRRGQGSNLSATQFGNYALGYNAVQLGTLPSISSSSWEENSIAYMARLNYVFKNKYMITGTVRKDGFSGFGATKKYATFPSLSVAWVASDEDFVKNLGKWLNLLKLRVSYGANGNQGIGRYSSFSRMSSNDFVFGSTTAIGVFPSSLGNIDLGWETTEALNLGLDYAVLDYRLSGSIEVYSAKTTNVLVNRTVPYSTGYNSVWTNIGQIDNKGIELSLKTVNIKGPLTWETRFAYSLNRDKITKLYGGAADKDIGNSWFVGQSISAIYDYKMPGGLWTEDDLYKGKTLTGFYPGQWKLSDLNGDGIIDANNDRSIIGYGTPNYRFSINNTVSYKNFSLNVFLNSVMGGNGYFLRNNANLLSAATVTDEVQRRNQYIIKQYWTPDNGVNNNPGIFNAPRIVAGLYEDRSFVRLQNVSLSYRFPEKLIRAVKISDLSMFISGRNLYTWTKWSGWDPETASNSLPLMKTVMAGINLTW
jgi:TonB-linked SusC/RagA family outer membrane protein